MATKKVLIMIAENSETVEIVAPVDSLRRVEGIEVTIASIHGRDPVKTTCGIIITPDVALSEVDKDGFDAVIMPGGDGHVNLKNCALVGEILKNQYNKGRLVAGICMSPNVFMANEIGLGNKLTSYPWATEGLKEKYEYLEDAVVQDKNMITSRGPGTVYAYVCKIVENLVGIDEAKKLAELNLVFDLYK